MIGLVIALSMPLTSSPVLSDCGDGDWTFRSDDGEPCLPGLTDCGDGGGSGAALTRVGDTPCLPGLSDFGDGGGHDNGDVVPSCSPFLCDCGDDGGCGAALWCGDGAPCLPGLSDSGLGDGGGGLVLGGACRDGVRVESQPIVETLAVENGSLGAGGGAAVCSATDRRPGAGRGGVCDGSQPFVDTLAVEDDSLNCLGVVTMPLPASWSQSDDGEFFSCDIQSVSHSLGDEVTGPSLPVLLAPHCMLTRFRIDFVVRVISTCLTGIAGLPSHVQCHACFTMAS